MQRGPAATISRQPEYYHGWPTAALRENGELLVVYSGGREAHVCPFGRVEVIRSRDGGRAWSWPEVIMDSPIDDRDAGIMETPAGSILVTTFTSLAYEQVLQQATGWPAETCVFCAVSAAVMSDGISAYFCSLPGSSQIRMA